MRRATASDAKARLSKKRKVQVLDAPSIKPQSPTKRVSGPSSKVKVPPDVKVKKGKGKEPAVPQKDMAIISKHEDALPLLPKTFKIVAGSYEKLLYGLEAALIEDGEPGSSARRLQLKPIFIFPAHVSCVKAVAASSSGGKWLATGSADEIIKVWDLRRRKEIGGLIHHEGKLFAFHPCRAYNDIYSARLHHLPNLSLTITFAVRIGGRHVMPIPRTRLGCTPYSQRPQRPCELCWRPPIWKAGPKRWNRSYVAYVGSYAWQRFGQHKARQRFVLFMSV